tara:strand:- start:5189 stop:6133 length:945 start_codon:yes stop_codon:yes gene_type:complete
MRDELLKISKEIRSIVSERQKEIELSFIEDTHTYYIKNLDGEITTKMPSVSSVIKHFYTPFDDISKSYDLAQGCLMTQEDTLKGWKASADYATNKGSRVHYLLEMKLLEQYGSYKEVRQPIFECDEKQTKDGDIMIEAGLDFIKEMHRRGAVLLDTEMVLGSPRLGYTGQPDKVWLMLDKNGNLGFVITDWKTNKPENFEVKPFTEKMLSPFQDYYDTALNHYMIQLPLYGRLLLDMLKGTKYGDIKFFGCVIVHLMSEGVHKYVEYRVPKEFQKIVLTMNPLPRTREVEEYKKEYEFKSKNRRFNLAMYLGLV